MAYNIYTNHFHGQSISRKAVSTPKKTTDKQTIISWAEARNGVPVLASSTDSEKRGELRIHFCYTSKAHKPDNTISWDRFFEHFEQDQLALVYQEQHNTGESSTCYRLVNRN